MQGNHYKIRKATRSQLDILVEWAAKEGWNPGLYDADSFYTTDPKGFLIGFIDDEPISSISSVAYDQTFGFLGFYIVKPDYRGNGYGIQIWNEAIKNLPTQNIGLDGVVAQQKNYMKSGFKFAYRNIRYEGVGLKRGVSPTNIVSLSTIPFELVQSYDDSIFPVTRPTFLGSWLRQPESLSIGVLRGGKLHGYSMVRKCRNGFKVGPLFADNEKIADSLFLEMLEFVGEKIPIFLDIPEPNQQAVQLAERYQMKPMFETARMYTKEPPNVPIKKVFGLTTFELG